MRGLFRSTILLTVVVLLEASNMDKGFSDALPGDRQGPAPPGWSWGWGYGWVPIPPSSGWGTTEEPVVTTEEPIVTTEEPIVTTEEPIVTTEGPIVTTSAPEVTTPSTTPRYCTDAICQDGLLPSVLGDLIVWIVSKLGPIITAVLKEQGVEKVEKINILNYVLLFVQCLIQKLIQADLLEIDV